MQGRIQELASGGAQTGQVVDGWGEPDSLAQCCIFEVANDHLLVVSHCCFCHFGLFRWVWGLKSYIKALNVLRGQATMSYGFRE